MAEAGAFRFGFAAPAAAAAPQTEQEEEAAISGEEDAADTEYQRPSGRPQPLHPASEVSSYPRPSGPLQNAEQVEVAQGIVLLKGRVNASEAATLLNDERVESSDLVPEVYEGGFKLWEGAIDLCRWLVSKYGLTPDNLLTGSGKGHPPLQGKRVLELGCGHGIPGILAMLAGAEVHFQDFNKEVLTQLTIPNMAANMARVAPSRSHPSSRFFCGDWTSVGELLTQQGFGGHYDIIMTSESIYCIESQYKLLECIKQVLQPPHGVVYVAAKAYYFGVGGGIKTFTHAVKQDGIFEVNHVYKTAEDVTGCVTAVGAPAAAAIKNVPAAGGAQGEGEGTAGAEEGAEEGAAAAAGGSKTQQGGNVREVLELSFPLAIQPYFL